MLFVSKEHRQAVERARHDLLEAYWAYCKEVHKPGKSSDSVADDLLQAVYALMHACAYPPHRTRRVLRAAREQFLRDHLLLMIGVATAARLTKDDFLSTLNAFIARVEREA